MTRISADTLALRFYVRLRDNAQAYHDGTLTHAEFSRLNHAIWREAEDDGAPVVDRINVLLLGDLHRRVA